MTNAEKYREVFKNQVKEVKNNMMLELSEIDGRRDALIDSIHKLNTLLYDMDKNNG